VAATIDDIVHTRARGTRHRIIDASGQVRHVVVVGDQLCDDNGSVIGTLLAHRQPASDSTRLAGARHTLKTSGGRPGSKPFAQVMEIGGWGPRQIVYATVRCKFMHRPPAMR
jgi:hypothetical protein